MWVTVALVGVGVCVLICMGVNVCTRVYHIYNYVLRQEEKVRHEGTGGINEEGVGAGEDT